MCRNSALPLRFLGDAAILRPRRAERQRKQIVAGRYSYETWLTVALSELHLPHKAPRPHGHGVRGAEARGVVGCHRVAILFPRQRHLIDVLSLEDLTARTQRITGAAELRRRRGTQTCSRLFGRKIDEDQQKMAFLEVN